MYIALDMGTSNTRLWLCDNDKVLYSKFLEIGAGNTKTLGKSEFFARIKTFLDSFLDENNLTHDSIDFILASGMVGSELGLYNVPHISIPLDICELTNSLCEKNIPEITSIPFLIVPGLKKDTYSKTEDIMRGEEVETIGITDSLKLSDDAVLVLPGTHNKVICVDKEGIIKDFYTTFSGELLHNIISNTILTSQVSHQFQISEPYILRGAEYSKNYGLNSALFHIRVMALNGTDKDSLSSFLYGSVIGQDIRRILNFANNKHIFIGGRSVLKETYRILLGDSATALDSKICEKAVRTGLNKIQRLYKNLKLRNEVIKTINEEKLIAIIRNPDEDTFLPAMNALYRGGLCLAEITFDRSGKIPKESTAHFIELLKENLPILVGAGTVTSKEEVVLAYNAGASFIISPNCDKEIINLTRKLGLVSIPAGFTPTEIAVAIKEGADYVKIFPAEQIKKGYVKAVKAPLSDAKLLAVGGVNENNADLFIKEGFSGVGVGSNLYDKEIISKGDWDSLELLVKSYISALKKS